MERAFKKIKLEEEVQGNKGPSFLPISEASDWESAIYKEASASFDQLIASYKWKLAGHPVAIKIEEVQEPQEVEETVEVPVEPPAERLKHER